MRFIEFFVKYQLIFVFFLIILNYQSTNSQESELNKIIIENDFGNGRLLLGPSYVQTDSFILCAHLQ